MKDVNLQIQVAQCVLRRMCKRKSQADTSQSTTENQTKRENIESTQRKMTFKGITVQTMNDFLETMEQIEGGREKTDLHGCKIPASYKQRHSINSRVCEMLRI